MSKLVPSVELKKADGKPIKFNFQFENGLPMMPVINATYSVGEHEENNYPVFIIHLNEKQEKIYKVEPVQNIYIETGGGFDSLWISYNSFYIKIEDVEKKDYKKIFLVIADSNEKYIKQVFIDAS